MELPGNMTVYLPAGPEEDVEADAAPILAHMAYRVGSGPHLFCAGRPFTRRGGLLAMDHRGFDGRGEPESLCREVMSECAAREFSGVFCDFEGETVPVLAKAVAQLAPMLTRQGKTLYIPEHYAPEAPRESHVVVSGALMAGSLRRTLEEAAGRYGPDRLAVGLERLAEDIALPAAGAAKHLTREELTALLRDRSPAVYFSAELCAHYFTYMRSEGGAHYILYDDSASLAKKLRTAAALGIREAFLPYSHAGDLLPELIAGHRKTP